MKRISSILLIYVTITIAAFGQIPQSINYQAVIRDNAGQLLVTRNVSLRISILQSSPTGAIAYRETHSTLTTKQGIVNVKIGDGTSSDDFSVINWLNGPYFLKIELDQSGGNSYVDLGTTELVSVPFAMAAGQVSSIDWENVENKPIIPTNNIQLINGAGYLTTYTETDPLFAVAPAHNVTNSNINNWNSAYSWGNHANSGYLTSSSTATLTNKSGNVSMFSNDANYATWPSMSNNSGKFLLTNGSSTSWAYAVNSANSPLSISGGTLSLSMAGTGSSGYLSSSDWNMFNNKVSSPWLLNGPYAYYNSGNVGIGTSNPTSKLYILGNVEDGDERGFLRLKNLATGPKASVSIGLHGYNDKGAAFGYTSDTYAINDLGDFGVFTTNGRGWAIVAYYGQIRFYTNKNPDNSYAEKMRINELGNVGIGTTNPVTRLQVTEGDIYLNSVESGIIMTSPNGQCWKGTMTDAGTLQFQLVTCP